MPKTIVEFSQGCAEHYLGGCKAEGDTAAASIDIEKLIELIGEIALMLLTTCPLFSAPGQLVGAVKNPSMRQRILFRSHVAKRCDCCADHAVSAASGKLAECIRHCASELDDASIEAIHADANNPDYLVV